MQLMQLLCMVFSRHGGWATNEPWKNCTDSSHERNLCCNY